MKGYLLAIILATVVMGATVWGFSKIPSVAPSNISITIPIVSKSDVPIPAESANSPLLKQQKGVERNYLNTTLNFSFTLPDGFDASEQEAPTKGGQAVIMVNKDGRGVYVEAQKLKAGSGPLTADAIQPNAPGETVSNIQETRIAGGISGFTFHTNSALFKGDGQAVWFTHKGYLYKLSTYTRDAALLDLLRATWWFKN